MRPTAMHVLNEYVSRTALDGDAIVSVVDVNIRHTHVRGPHRLDSIRIGSFAPRVNRHVLHHDAR